MLEKTEAIIIHQLKYSDSGIVIRAYTKKWGRQSFLMKGIRNKKAGKHNIHFQPLSVLDMVIYYKESREMQSIKEFSVSYSPVDIHSNIKKSCIAIFLGEVLTSVLKEESPHEDLFDFLRNSVIYFDSCKEGYANFHIAFMVGLSSYLGFEPGKKNDPDTSYFDLVNGSFVSLPPVHGNYSSVEVSEILSQFFVASYDNIHKIILSGTKRNEVLETIIRYYSIHLPGLKKINSLEVLKEVFS
jgi:DNA repair protein RecO (recombination protein O)